MHRPDPVISASSLIVAYFLGLAYTSLEAGILIGFEGYGLLLLAACIFGAIAARYKRALGASFLLFYNASRWYFFGSAIFYLASQTNLTQLSSFSLFLFPFGVFVALNFAYVLGFDHRTSRYFLLWLGAEQADQPTKNRFDL